MDRVIGNTNSNNLLVIIEILTRFQNFPRADFSVNLNKWLAGASLKLVPLIKISLLLTGLN
jgi:hypothetical protein